MSALADAATDYLKLRRSLGHTLIAAGTLLPRNIAYLGGIGHDTITDATAFAWATDVSVGNGTRKLNAVEREKYVAAHWPATG
jgi:integrase/recombinase XerD